MPAGSMQVFHALPIDIDGFTGFPVGKRWATGHGAQPDIPVMQEFLHLRHYFIAQTARLDEMRKFQAIAAVEALHEEDAP